VHQWNSFWRAFRRDLPLNLIGPNLGFFMLSRNVCPQDITLSNTFVFDLGSK
jgi:hypothetical protein